MFKVSCQLSSFVLNQQVVCLYTHMCAHIYTTKGTHTSLLLEVAVGVVSLPPAPTSVALWLPAANIVPGLNSDSGIPFWRGGKGGNTEKGGVIPSCPLNESWEPCSNGGRGGVWRRKRRKRKTQNLLISKFFSSTLLFIATISLKGRFISQSTMKYLLPTHLLLK